MKIFFFTGLKVTLVAFLWASMAQAQEKRKVSKNDYKLWHNLTMGVTSDDGVWASYSKLYESQRDTLFLKNTETGFEYFFPKGYNEKISKKGDLFAYLQSGSLYVLNPDSGGKQKYLNVDRYMLSEEGKYLIYQSGKTLTLEQIKSGRTKQFEDVSEFNVCPNLSYVAVIQNNEETASLRLVSLKDFEVYEVDVENPDIEYQQAVWNNTGNSLGYYIFDRNTKNYKIGCLRVDKQIQEYRLDSFGNQKFLPNRSIIKSKLYVSDEGDKVFFDIQQNDFLNHENGNVTVWKSSDKEVPPKSKIRTKKWSVWKPIENSVYEIEDDNLMVCGLTDNQGKALLLDNKVYLPFFEFDDQYSDVYLIDLNNGKKEKILEKQSRANQHLVTEPNGKYLAYFKNNHWWSYDIKAKSHYCLTENIPLPFNKYDSDRLDKHHAFGFGGWTNSGELLVYDEYDIWLISADAKKREKLTNGRAGNVIHRVYTYTKSSIRDGFFGFTTDVYDLHDDLLIHTLNSEKLSEGFGIWNRESGFKEIVHKDFKIHYIKRIGKNKGFEFFESRFNISPQIVYLAPDGKQKIIAQSNEHQKQFYWGKSELIYYHNQGGERLKGVLFYPANYRPEKKYPMIVSIYEKKSYTLHEYVNPSLTNFTGFNVTNFTQEDYFVLLPDIAYLENQPGKSALNCVLAAVTKALDTGSIDENELGLIGHSFGGFETAYIVSQTDRFKAVISSSGVNDLLSFYLDIDSSNLSNMERFERGQFRNRFQFTSLAFQEESPIMNVETINTPILLWTGDIDNLVPPSYSIKLYAALWRLQKKCTLLIYSNEPHIVVNPINQKDITDKTLSWFNYHLKEFPREEWMYE